MKVIFIQLIRRKGSDDIYSLKEVKKLPIEIVTIYFRIISDVDKITLENTVVVSNKILMQ
jgi:hypothetical protein